MYLKHYNLILWPFERRPEPVIVDVKPRSTSKSEVPAEPAESPSPSDIIDWVFKKKAK